MITARDAEQVPGENKTEEVRVFPSQILHEAGKSMEMRQGMNAAKSPNIKKALLGYEEITLLD